MKFEVKRMTLDNAIAVSRWKYSEPYKMYNICDGKERDYIDSFTDLRNNYFTLHFGEILVAFFCIGSDSRVPGGDYSVDAIDIGLGIAPDCVGRKISREVIPRVLEECRHGKVWRVTIAEWNLRAIAAWRRFGFTKTMDFLRTGDSMKFGIYLRR